jgi:hypothetical protein
MRTLSSRPQAVLLENGADEASGRQDLKSLYTHVMKHLNGHLYLDVMIQLKYY